MLYIEIFRNKICLNQDLRCLQIQLFSSLVLKELMTAEFISTLLSLPVLNAGPV